jgi:hypothetical protein
VTTCCQALIASSTQGFWEINTDAIGAGGKTAGSNIDSIVDTGTSLVVGDQGTVAAIYAEIPGSKDASNTAGPGFFTCAYDTYIFYHTLTSDAVPCDSNPDVSVTLGGKAFSISADTLNLGQLSEGSDDCVGGIMAASDLPAFILGDVFLENVYTGQFNLL